jgi:uncharacterized protein (DUF1800 family)
MVQQIDTLRQHGSGSFRDLVFAVARDPAMIVYLDSESSTKEHPNENFARELMELFTCGIGHYTEHDVLEAARAFTGWHRDGARFVFNAELHDSGIKTLFGRRGRFDGGDVIDLLLALPATPRFLARKLLRFFAAPDPAPEVVDEAAQVFDRTQLNIRLFLKELFASRYFFSPECYKTRIASPAEFVVGTVRSLAIRQAAGDLAGQLSAMGQELFAPPNVKGWDGEQSWINSTSLAARHSFARGIVELNAGNSRFNAHFALDSVVPPDLAEPRQVVDRLAEVLLQGELAPETRSELASFLTSPIEAPAPEAFASDPGYRESRIRQLVGVMLALPEYQAY